MSFTARDAKARLVTVLGAHLDAALAPHGFRRPPKGTVYRRTFDGVHQQIELFAQRPNNAEPELESLVQAWLSVELDPLLPAALALVAGRAARLGDAPTRILRMPTGFTTPKRAADTWRVRHDADWQHFARDFEASCAACVVPFLDEHRDAAAFARSWDRGDTRLVFLEDLWVVKLAAAYVVAGRPEDAERFARIRLTTAASKRRFASVLAWFER